MRGRDWIGRVHRFIAADVDLRVLIVRIAFELALELMRRLLADHRRRRWLFGAIIHSSISVDYHSSAATSGDKQAFPADFRFDRMQPRFCQWAGGARREARFGT